MPGFISLFGSHRCLLQSPTRNLELVMDGSQEIAFFLWASDLEAKSMLLTVVSRHRTRPGPTGGLTTTTGGIPTGPDQTFCVDRQVDHFVGMWTGKENLPRGVGASMCGFCHGPTIFLL